MDVEKFIRLPLLGILRGIRLEELEPVVQSVLGAGLETIEVTMNTEGASEIIGEIRALAKGRLTVGAGTVLTMQSLEAALEAGATFVVTPTLIPDVTRYCVDNAIPVFPGALTPTEIYQAWRSGATMVKVFPAGLFGPSYFKEIKGPFSEIQLLACGGVNANNIGAYRENGACAAAFGSSIFNRAWLDREEYARIGSEIRKLIAASTDV